MTASKTHPLLTAHAEAIAKREAATTPGVAAGATRRIGAIELELTIEGVEFRPWEPPIKQSSRKALRSDADLLARIDTVHRIKDDPQHPASIRRTAETHLRDLLSQAEKRGIEVPTPATPAPKPKRSRAKVAA